MMDVLTDWGTERIDSPELRLWRQALALMIHDAAMFAQGRPLRGGDDTDGRQAYREVSKCGERLRRLCDFADRDAEYVTTRFNRWVERLP
jgi:hypothetical protein